MIASPFDMPAAAEESQQGQAPAEQAQLPELPARLSTLPNIGTLATFGAGLSSLPVRCKTRAEGQAVLLVSPDRVRSQTTSSALQQVLVPLQSVLQEPQSLPTLDSTGFRLAGLPSALPSGLPNGLPSGLGWPMTSSAS